MDSLKIQDAFEPYYAGRKRFAARRDKRQPVKAQNDADSAANSAEARQRLLRRLLAEPRTKIETETDSTAEH
ncbi:hypothetical protein [Mesorhizobium amorphae]|uniref:hypothetical protein n=1 Tax=Mesorhizobium amorphae TaxID=71433 RepID=UPI001781EAE7|nr:hypothetical protein [Mesorhizobium amorphae]